MRILFGMLVLCALLLGVCAWVVHDNSLDLIALEGLRPFTQALCDIGYLFTSRIVSVSKGSLVLIALLLAVTWGIARWRKSSSGYFLVFFLAVVAQYLFIFEAVGGGVFFEILAVVAGLSAVRKEPLSLEHEASTPLDRNDFFILFGITCLALFFRTYALNQIHSTFDGELSPYYLGATNILGIFQANAGLQGPWAPLGLLFYIPAYLSYQFFGISLLSIRISSVLTSILTIWLVYLFIRSSWSRVAAGIAAVLLSLDGLQVGWGRTDIHPHGSTTWPSLLLAMMTLRAIQSGRIRDWWLVVPFMGLTWHQYPSGQLGFLIPVIVVGWMFLQRELRAKQVCKITAILGCGVIIWGLGSIAAQAVVKPDFTIKDYIAQLGPRFFYNTIDSGHSFADRILFLLKRVSAHTVDIVQGIFVKAPYLFHQDIIIPLSPMAMRTISWIVVVLSFPALILMRERPLKRILIAMLIAGIIPAVFSDHAYPKRGSTIYPVLCALAGIGAAILWREVTTLKSGWIKASWVTLSVCGLVAWISIESWQWFGGMRLKYGVPYDIFIAEKLKTEMTPHSITAFIGRQHYFDGKMSLLLFEKMKSLVGQSAVFGYISSDVPKGTSPDALWNQRFSDRDFFKEELLRHTILYKWTELRDSYKLFSAPNQPCEKLNLWIQLEGEGKGLLERVRGIWPDAKVERFENPNVRDESFALVVITSNSGFVRH